MSWLLKRGRVHPNGEQDDNVSVDTTSTTSMTPTELDMSIRELLKTNAPRNICEDFFRGSPITSSGKIKQLFKILSIVMVPVIILTVLTANTFFSTFSNYTKSSKIRSTLLYSVELGRVIHYLQEERDISALYLSSIAEKTKSLVLMRYSETDRSLEELTYWMTGPTLTRKEFKSKGKFLTYLNKHRYELDTLNQTVTMELQLYTTLIRVFVTWLYDAVLEDQSGSIWRSLVAYEEVVIAKEYMGLERALGTIFYATGQFPTVDVYLWFLESQDVTNATFLSARRYSDLVHHLYEQNFNGDEIMLGVLAHMRAEIRRNDREGLGSVKMAQWWFNNMTVYMDLLLVTQRQLAVEITEMLDTRQDTNMTKMLAISIMFVCVFIISAVIIYAVYSLTDEIQMFSLSLSERSSALNKEKKRTDILLYQMLPKSVADILKQHEEVEPQNYSAATIFFSDIQGFTQISSCCSPVQVIQMLNSMYSCFDDVIAKYDVYKVETIGDAYMVVSGLKRFDVNLKSPRHQRQFLANSQPISGQQDEDVNYSQILQNVSVPKPNGFLHASEICSMALELLYENNHAYIPHLPGTKFKMRFGIHSGPVVAAVVGSKMPRYCLFGETVTVAARMEALGKAGKIQISESTYDILADCTEFIMEERIDDDIMREFESMISMKGRSRTFWIMQSGSTNAMDSSSVLISGSSDNEDHSGGKDHAWEDH